MAKYKLMVSLELNPLDIESRFNYLYLIFLENKYDLSNKISFNKNIFMKKVDVLGILAPYDYNSYIYRGKLLTLVGEDMNSLENLDQAFKHANDREYYTQLKNILVINQEILLNHK